MNVGKNQKIRLVIILSLLAGASIATADTIFVDTDAIGNNDGSSWDDAYNYLQDALAVASSGDDIRVAQGIYKPDQGYGITLGDREATFQLINDVTLKGGYAGAGAADPNPRNIELYETILTGDLRGDDGPDFAGNGENSYHVITGCGVDLTTLLDGFTITSGNADGPFQENKDAGAGMFNDNSDLKLINCTFKQNSAESGGRMGRGGGMYNKDSNPTLTYCIISDNFALYGGGMYNKDSNPTLTNCTFNGNSVSQNGGGIYNQDSNLILTNCTFSYNESNYGGGIDNHSGHAILADCLFSMNYAWEGAGIGNSGNMMLTNCIFDKNSDACGLPPFSCIWYSENMTLANCIFNRNSGSGMKGYGKILLTNCTFTRNDYGVWSLEEDEYGGPTLTNCILWGNGSEINWDIKPPIVNYCCIQGLRGNLGGIGNIDADPLFTDPNSNDYHLLIDSPCINAGDPDYIQEPNETDLDGRPRVIAGQIDMGAYEFQNPCVIYVDDDAPNDPGPGDPSVSDPLEDGTQAHPFDAIQEAIDTAYERDEIIVAKGQYNINEPITFRGKNITLKSEAGPDVTTIRMQNPINPERASVFIFYSEHRQARLEGFTITGGGGTKGNPAWNDWYAQRGGGILCAHGTTPTITANRIIGNTAEWGGGIFGGSPYVVDNLIENNTAEAGGGISTYFGVIENNVIKGNSVVWYGGGVWCNGYDPQIIGNEIVDNTAGGRGAGISMQEGSTPTILNNLIIGNFGGGIYLEESGPDIANNVIADNLGYGVKLYWNEGARITNSIIWGNDEGSNIISEKSIHSRGITYNDIQGGWPEEGNIDADPLFVARGEGSEPWFDADYHLLPDSPCIDAGNPNHPYDPNETDLDGRPRVIGGRIDMGAYEYQPRVIYVDDDAPNDPGPGDPSVSDPLENGTKAHPFDAIQEAIDISRHADTIIVTEGTYVENINFMGKNITLKSTHPDNPHIVAATIIDGNNIDSVVTFAGTENETCVLSGFTIQNGFQDYNPPRGGGGICGGSEQNHTKATIKNNIITLNFSRDGGGLYWCDGLIEKNIIIGNTARWYQGGGGLSQCNGIIRSNLIAGNFSGGCESGSALSYCDGTIENNTITNNSTDGEGTLVRCRGTIRNCIIWGNIGWPPQLNMCSTPSFSCIEDWTGGGEGNIDTDPCFVDPGHWEDPLNTPYNWRDDVWVNGEYHLLPDSPCIDTGDPNYVAEPNETDLDGKPRVIAGRIDMGAYEAPIPAEARIVPRTINLASKGKRITSYIWLPEDYNVADIDANSVFLDSCLRTSVIPAKAGIQAQQLRIDEKQQFAIVMFDREEVQSILDIGDIELTIIGRLTNGTIFEATDTIKVIDKADKK